MKYAINALASALLLVSGSAFTHENQAQVVPKRFDASQVVATSFGQAGDPKKVTRTIRVAMDDRMRFEPENLTARKGETVRLVVANKGSVLHEMVLGTAQALKEHAELMKKHPGMEHDEPNMAHVKPGTMGEIVWRFSHAGEFQFACLIPGHFEAGMVGKVTVK